MADLHVGEAALSPPAPAPDGASLRRGKVKT
jgi:hypothetical protein